MQKERRIYLTEPSAANRDRSQRLCNVMDIDEADIKAAAWDLVEWLQYAYVELMSNLEELGVLTVSK